MPEDPAFDGAGDVSALRVDFPDRDYAGYIFDCDGTLAHTMPLYLAAWNHGLARADAPFRFDGASMMSVAGMAMEQTLLHLEKAYGVRVDHREVDLGKDIFYERWKDTIGPIPAVVNYAKALAQRGARLAVASGGARPKVLYTPQKLGIRDLFAAVVTADDVVNAKPAPDLFLKAAELLGVRPEACLVIEDSELGIAAARTCGMDWVRVPRTI